MQLFKVLTEVCSQPAWVYAAKALTLLVIVGGLGRAAQPRRFFLTLIALYSKHQWRRNQAIKILQMSVERHEPETKSRRVLRVKK